MANLNQYERSVPKGKLYRLNPPAPAIITEGTTENFGKWSLNEEGLLTIDGKGDMPDWSLSPWHGHSYLIWSVQISDGVTSIGIQAFDFCSFLTSVFIPTSITSIGCAAFRECEHLTTITIPDGVSEIGELAFGFCRRLASITLPNSVAKVGRNLFFGCNNLKKVTMPANALLSQLPLRAGKTEKMFFRYLCGISKDIVIFT